jgi:hypothetical protein
MQSVLDKSRSLSKARKQASGSRHDGSQGGLLGRHKRFAVIASAANKNKQGNRLKGEMHQ